MPVSAPARAPKQPVRPSPSPTPDKRAGRGAAAWRNDPEVRLMLRVRDGDATAFAELEARYRTRVLGWFCRRLGDRIEAEDLTQEVFLRLYRARSGYQPRACFATWVFHITRNVARNALRSRRRRPCVRLETAASEPGLLEAILPVSGDSPSRPMERAELAGVVRAAVAGLAGRQRAAVELHQFAELTYTEVAAELDMTAKAAKSLLYRAAASCAWCWRRLYNKDARKNNWGRAATVRERGNLPRSLTVAARTPIRLCSSCSFALPASSHFPPSACNFHRSSKNPAVATAPGSRDDGGVRTSITA